MGFHPVCVGGFVAPVRAGGRASPTATCCSRTRPNRGGGAKSCKGGCRTTSSAIWMKVCSCAPMGSRTAADGRG
eukprot:6886995-Lingulodinium_polyedra.AAC.1